MNRVEPNRNVYIGHRYVPLLVGEWDKSIQYEGLSIVTFKGASYTSKKMTPPGIDIENGEYWVLTGNYDAQVEYYRLETKRVSDDLEQAKKDLNKRIDDNVEYINTNVENLTIYVNDEVRKNKEYVDGEVTELTGYLNDEVRKNKEYVDGEVSELTNHVNDEVSDLTGYVNDEVRKNKEYVDSNVEDLTIYVDNEIYDYKKDTDEQFAHTVGYSVDEYGAVGDGVTNDTDVIQNLIDSVGSDGGGTIVFSAKTYIATLKIPNNIRLLGMGHNTVIKLRDNQSTPTPVIVNEDKVNGNTNITIENLRIDGNRSNICHDTIN